MNPTVSIIIPLYNAEATLDRCLESILSQSQRDIEVLCINDASTDGSVKILRQWRNRDDRVHIQHFSRNRGPAIAIKIGLLNAKGKYVMIVDADDRLLPGAIENAVRQIEESGVDVLQFGIRIATQPGTTAQGFEKFFPNELRSSEGINILYDCFMKRRISHNYLNKIDRREICRAAAASMPDLWIRQFADLYLAFFLLYYAKTFRGVPDICYEYMFGNGMSTSAPSEKQFSELCESSAILPAIEGFLRRENALENNRFLLESIEVIMKSDAVNKLLTLPEITKETVDLAVKSWGNGILYDFIEATGMLEVKCKSRQRMVPVLVGRLQQQRAESRASAGETTLTVGSRNTMPHADGVQAAKQESMP